MKRSVLIYLGLIFLVMGVLMKNLSCCAPWALGFIILGVAFKLVYLVSYLISGIYRPGKEVLLLLLGLLVFFTGIYFRKNAVTCASLLLYGGLLMKTAFVFLFVRRIRQSSRKS